MIEIVSSLNGYTTLKAASERLDVTPEAVYGWVLRRSYPIKRLGRTLLIRETDLTDYRKQTSKR